MAENDEPTQDQDPALSPRPRPRPPESGVTPQQIHAADQLTGYMSLEAMNTGAYFRALLDAGFHRAEAFDICKLQVVERFRSLYAPKPPTTPPK
jgi:hypothetical protein